MRPVLAAVVTLALCLGITAAGWASIVDVAREDAVSRFESDADQAAQAVESELSQYAFRLRDIGTFVASDGLVSPDAFVDYVGDSQLFEQIPSIVGVLYIARVPDAQLEAFVAAAQRSDPGFAVFEIAPPTGGVRYLLTNYAPGRVDLHLPIGTDVAGLATVNQTVTASSETGGGVAGSFQDDPVLRRVAGSTEFPMIDALLGLDFFIGVPVYAPGSGAGGPPEQPVGWIAATIGDFHDVADGATRAFPGGLGMALTVELDGAEGTDDNNVARVAEVPGEAGARDHASFASARTIDIGGIRWSLAVWSGPDADAVPSSARLALAAGIAGSALAAGLVYGRLRERDRERAYAAELTAREQFQREIIDSVTNPMVVVDQNGSIVRSNPAWDDLWPTGPGRVDQRSAGDRHDGRRWSGVSYLDVLEAPTATGLPALRDAIEGVLARASGTTGVDVEVALVGADVRSSPSVGSVLDRSAPHRPAGVATVTEEHTAPTWLSIRVTPLRGRPGAIVTHADITERKRTQDQLEVQAASDNLTGLANRITFEDELEQALVPTRTSDHRLAVLFIDLDGFKPINDTYGHAVGDDVLRAVALRIGAVVRSSDTAARLGGDEFVVLVNPLSDPSVAEATAERILSALRTPIRTDDRAVEISASIGVAVIEGPSSATATSLIERADAAMYASKQQGGARATVAAD